MLLRSRSIAVLTTVLALSSVAGASAASKPHTAVNSHAKVSKAVSAAKSTKGSTTVHPVKTGGSPVAMISAFPTGGKGSGSEATCRAWSTQLEVDQNDQEEATAKDDVIATTETLNADKNNAMDAGCVVID